MFQIIRRGAVALAVPLVLAAPALAQSRPPTQPPPSSPYPDGTGNSAVDRLNNAQLNANYRGWTYTTPGAPGTVAYTVAPPAPPGYVPAYGPPRYPVPAPPPAYIPPGY